MWTEQSIKNYEIKATLGKGSSSEVYLATDSIKQIPVAIKLLKPQRSYLYNTESRFFKRVASHENILKLHLADAVGVQPADTSTSVPGRMPFFALEYCCNGNMFNYILNLERFPQSIARWYFAQLLDALEAIHLSGMYHGDIKLDNLLLSQDYILKLSDFGFSDYESDRSDKFCGTPGYMSPEMLERRHYSGQAYDIFAACTLLFIMIHGHPPFKKAIASNHFYKHIYCGRYEEYWKQLPTRQLDSMGQDLFQKAFSFTPQNRLSIQQLRQHPWMQGPFPTHGEVVEFMKQQI